MTTSEPLSLADPARLMRQMSHDLRSPMNVLTATLSMLVEGVYGDLTPEMKKAAVRMKRNNDRLLYILDSFMFYVKAEAGQYEPLLDDFDAYKFLKDLFAAVRPITEAASINSSVVIDPTVPPQLRGDVRAIREVLMALVWNAVGFTEDGGAVRLAAAYTDERLCVTVRDTGPGIAPEDVARMYEPFYRNIQPLRMTPTPGCGLGLTAAKSLTQAMKGELKLDQTNEHGSIFSVVLPLVATASNPR